ncbi:hypothetical protein, partial [Neoroseomonas rubea]|uniref:hypothetical protein n=1 Tax=Neoroseomonas rubea TaxID=2748666 RepID=UPI001E3D29A1
MWRILLLFVPGLVLAGPAWAQTRTLVVPPGDAVVIAPRSQPAPRATLAPPPRLAAPRPRSEPAAETLG